MVLTGILLGQLNFPEQFIFSNQRPRNVLRDFTAQSIKASQSDGYNQDENMELLLTKTTRISFRSNFQKIATRNSFNCGSENVQDGCEKMTIRLSE